MRKNIVEDYINYATDVYMKIHPDVDQNQVKNIIDELVKSNISDIPCTLKNNVTQENLNTSMLNLFTWAAEKNPVITGNGTFFKQHEEYLSPEITMLETLQAERKQIKKAMFKCEKGSSAYINNYNGQINVKVIMNADYGGSGTIYSAFYSPYIPPATTATAKNITTTLICCLEFLSGNNDPWVKNNSINELFDMIRIVLSDDNPERELVKDNVSPDELFEYLKSKTNNLQEEDLKLLKAFCKAIDVDERSKLMNSFNLRRVLKLHCQSDIMLVSGYLKEHVLDFSNKLTKEALTDGGFGVTAPDAIAEAINRIAKVCKDNCIYHYILNDAEVRANNTTRKVVCVTDTDSLMVHFSSFVSDFMCELPNFKQSCILAGALGIRLFVEHFIPAYVEFIAKGMQIKDKYYRDKFVFKNEFTFLAMSLFAKKMYSASMFVQEGEPRDIHDIAFTGLSFKKRDAAEFLEPVMTELYDKYVLTGADVDVSSILDSYYRLREEMKTKICKTTEYHKVLSIKDINAYDPNRVLPDQMRGAIVWNNIMPDEEMLPLDRIIVIPLSFSLLDQHAHEDPRTYKILELSMVNNEKRKYDPVICLPESYKEIPSWIQNVVDIEGSLDKLLTPFKQLLGLFDIYLADTNKGVLPSRMIYL